MKKILIYQDKGANRFGIASLLSALKEEKIDQKYQLKLANKDLFQETDWQKETKVIIFPGGRDTPYHKSLKGTGNQNIRDFVEKGGSFLGICAGGYYGSAMIEFEQGGPLEICATRELKFFPGVARGPAFGLGKFNYLNEDGAEIAKISLSETSSPTAAYYNGGCAFMDAEKYPSISVIARYLDIEGEPAAIVKCQVGAGCAILSGVHPEYSAYHECTNQKINRPLFLALKQIEEKRRALFSCILQHFFL